MDKSTRINLGIVAASTTMAILSVNDIPFLQGDLLGIAYRGLAIVILGLLIPILTIWGYYASQRQAELLLCHTPNFENSERLGFVTFILRFYNNGDKFAKDVNLDLRYYILHLNDELEILADMNNVITPMKGDSTQTHRSALKESLLKVADVSKGYLLVYAKLTYHNSQNKDFVDEIFTWQPVLQDQFAFYKTIDPTRCNEVLNFIKTQGNSVN